MDAFSKAFGPKKQVMDGEIVEEKPAAQDQVMMSIMKKLVPGFDPNVIGRMAQDIGTGLERFDAKLDTIIANQAIIMARIDDIEAKRKLCDDG